MKNYLLLFLLLISCTFSLSACAKIVMQDKSNATPYPNDEYIVINDGKSITVLNDNFDVILEFNDLPRFNQEIYSSVRYPYMSSGFYDISQALVLGKDSGSDNGNYGLYKVPEGKWIEEGYDYIFWDLNGYHGAKDDSYYHFNFQGDIIEISDEEIPAPIGDKQDISYDASIYDGGYYVWGDYFVLYKRGEMEDSYSLFYRNILLVEDVTQMAYQFGDDYFVCYYIGATPDETRVSVIYGKDGSELYRTKKDETIVSVNKEISYILEADEKISGDVTYVIKDLDHQIIYEHPKLR